jgi:hypothetical protein
MHSASVIRRDDRDRRWGWYRQPVAMIVMARLPPDGIRDGAGSPSLSVVKDYIGISMQTVAATSVSVTL